MLRRVRSLIACGASALLVSCSLGNKANIGELDATPVRLEETGISDVLMPDQVAFVDSFLVVINRETSPAFYVYSRENLSPMGTFGTAGQGPKDFMFPFFLSGDNGKELQVYDLPNSRIYGVDVARVLAGEEDWCSTTALPEKVMGCSNLYQSGDRFWGNIDNGPGLFFIYDRGSDAIEWIPFPSSLLETEPDYTVGNMNRIAVCKSKGRIASAMTYYNKVFLYDEDGNLLEEKGIGDDEIKPFFTEEGLSEESRYFCSDIKCTDTCLYLMLQQVTEGDSFQAKEGKESRILVLDWDLNPVKTYQLDGFGKRFFLDEELHRIYVQAIDSEGNLGIKAFDE